MDSPFFDDYQGKPDSCDEKPGPQARGIYTAVQNYSCEEFQVKKVHED